MLRTVWDYAVRWKARISFALLDQACSSGSSFVLTVLVARCVPLESFGAYALVWLASLCCEGVSTSLINDPLPAVLGKRCRSLRPHLLEAASWINMSLAGVLSLAIIASALLLSPWMTELGLQLALLALVSPFQRVQYFIRRLCYLQDRQGVAATASFASATVLLSGAIALLFADSLTAPAAVLLWGAAGIATICVGIASGVWRLTAARYNIITRLIRQLWASGRWLIGAGGAHWISNLAMLPLAAAFAGPAAAGILRALLLLFMPLMQANGAINIALLPRLAEMSAGESRHRMRSIALTGLVLYVAIASSYSAVILVVSETLLSFLYQKQEITAAAGLLWPLALATIMELIAHGAVIILVAMAQSRPIFLTRMLSGLVFLLSLFVLVPTMGLAGIVWAHAMSSTVAAILFARSLFAALADRPSMAVLSHVRA